MCWIWLSWQMRGGEITGRRDLLVSMHSGRRDLPVSMPLVGETSRSRCLIHVFDTRTGHAFLASKPARSENLQKPRTGKNSITVTGKIVNRQFCLPAETKTRLQIALDYPATTRATLTGRDREVSPTGRNRDQEVSPTRRHRDREGALTGRNRD